MSDFTEFDVFEPVHTDSKVYITRWPVMWEIGRKGSGWELVMEAGKTFDISVPRWLEWALSPHDRRILPAALVHDELLREGHDAAFASAEFRRAAIARGAGRLLAWWLFIVTLVWTAFGRSRLPAARLQASVFASMLAIFAALDPLPSLPDHTHVTPPAEIYMFRGMAGTVFSTGLHPLGARLQKDGFMVDMLPWWGGQPVYRKIIRSGAKRVGLVCHSAGCSTALAIARALEKTNIRVCLLAAFDPASRRTAGSNIRQVLSWTQGKFAPVRPAENFRGRLESHRPRGLDHVAIAGMREAHERIIDAMKTGCSG